MDKNITHTINYERFAQEVETMREENPALKNEHLSEAVRHVIASQLKSVSRDNNGPSFVGSVGHVPANSYLPSYAREISDKDRNVINGMIRDTLEHGLAWGFDAAKKLPPFLIDLYHDALTEKLTQQLEERGLL